MPKFLDDIIVSGGSKVGINTSAITPEAALTIKGNPTNTDQPVRITNSVTDVHTGLFLNGTGNVVNEKYGMQFGNYNEYSIGGIFGVMDSGSASTSGDITIDFANGTSAGSLIEKVRFTHEGRVGIGTDSPAEKIHVYADGSDVAIKIEEDAGSHQAKLHLRRGGSDWEIINDNHLTIEGEGVERFRITTGGDVGVGTNSPGYKLEIAEDTDGTADLLMLRNSDSTYAQTWGFQSDTNKDLVITGSSGAGGFKFVPGSRGSTFAGDVNIESASTNSEDVLNLKSGADNVDEYLGLTFTTGVGGSGPHGAIRVYNGPSSSDAYMSFLTTTNGGTLTQGLTLDHLGAATFAGTIGSGAITSTSHIEAAQHFKATNSNMSFHAGGTQVLNIDVNKNIYPSDDSDGSGGTTDLGFSDSTYRFRNGYFSGELQSGSLDINGNADISGQLFMGQGSAYSPTGGGSTRATITHGQSARTDVVISNQTNHADAGAALVLATYGHDFIMEGTSSAGGSLLTFHRAGTLMATIASGQTTIAGELEATSLDINGNADISGSLTITGAILNNVENASLDIYGGNDTTNDAHIKLHGNANNYGSMELNYGYDATNSYFKVKQGSTENFVLQGGNATFAGDVNINSVFGFNTSTDCLTITNNQNTGGINLSGGNSRIYFGGNRAIEGAQDGSILYTGESYAQTSSLSDTQTWGAPELMRLNSTGLGIGTTSPQNILHLKSNDPKVYLEDGNAATNEKVYVVYPAGSQYVIQTKTDAYGAGQQAYVIDRTGTTVDGQNWYINSNAVFSLNSSGNAAFTGALSATSYTGTLLTAVTAVTQSASTNNTTVATTAYADTAIANLVASAPGTLNTLNELAAALGDDASFSTTVTNSIATKLPLAGGTITGHVLFTDGSELRLGADTDMGLFASSGTSHIRVNEGIFALRADDLRLMNQANDESYIRAAANGAVTVYYDNSAKLATKSDGVDITGELQCDTLDVDGTSDFNSAGTNLIASFTSSDSIGEIRIADSANYTRLLTVGDTFKIMPSDGDEVFNISDTAVSVLTPLTVGADGAGHDVKFFLNASGRYIIVDEDDNSLIFTDNANAKWGNGGDLQISHDGTDSRIDNMVGHLKIRNYSDASDIIFETDNGSGSTAEYLRFDGGITSIVVSKDLLMGGDGDGGKLKFGASQDLQIYHDGSNSYITNATGNLIVDAAVDIALDAGGGDIYLKDDGTEFGRLSNVSSDFVIYSATSDKDILFKGNDGGSTITALTLDMSVNGNATFSGSGTFNTTLNVNAPDEGGSPAMTAITNMHGYEGRGVGIKMRDSVNSASGASDREWFVGTGYGSSGFNIGYAADGSSSSYAAQAKFSITTGGSANFVGDVTAGAADTAAKFKAFHSDGAYTEQSGTGLVLSRSNSYIQSSADNSTTLNIGQSSVRWGHVKLDSADFEVLNGGTRRMYIDSSGNATFAGGSHTDGIVRSRKNIVSNNTYNVISLNSSRGTDDYGGLNKDYMKIDLYTSGASTDGGSSEHRKGNFSLKLANTIDSTAMGEVLGITSAGNATFAGTITHDGLVQTAGTAIDQLTTVNMTFQLSANTWTDTGINSGELASGTYAMQCYVEDFNAGGLHYYEYYSATMSWYGSGTNSTNYDEIVTHVAGHANNTSHLQFRTLRHASGGDNLMLQVKQSFAHSAALDSSDGKTMTFKFRRLI